MTTRGDTVAVRLPHFLLIGAAKAGTTGLAGELRYHPDIFMVGRETSFFTYRWVKGVDWYSSLFDKAPDDALLGEKTPAYMMDPVAMERAAKLVPQAKLIALVRDPVTRLLSQVNHRMQEGRLPSADVVDATYLRREIVEAEGQYAEFVSRGFYLDQLRSNVLPAFPASQLLVRATDEIQRVIDRGSLVGNETNPNQLLGAVESDDYQRLLTDVWAFLGVRPPRSGKHRLLGVREYHFTVADDAIDLLRGVYDGRNRGLSEFTGQVHSWE